MKYIEERIVKFLMLLSIGIVAFCVLSVLWTIFKRGLAGALLGDGEPIA